MRRRDLLLAAVCGAVPWPARAAAVAVGWLSYFGAADAAANRDAFLKGMTERGLVRDRDFRLVERYADERIEQVDVAVRELAALPVAVIVTYGPAIARALDARLNAPVLYAFSGDPVDAGFTTSFARPDRNGTGIAYLAADLNAKRIELLREMLPQLSRLALLSNPLHPGQPRELAVAGATAGRLGLELVSLQARDAAGVEAALADPAMRDAGALIVLSDILTVRNRARIIEVAGRRGIPVVAGLASFARSGALFSYGPELGDVYRRLAGYAGRIIAGASCAELPVEQPERFELVINLKAARSLGMTLPPAILARADEVIE